MRRLPPNKIEQSLSGLLNLIPEETDELLQRVDQPLEESIDPESVIILCNLIIILRYISRVAVSCSATIIVMAIPTGDIENLIVQRQHIDIAFLLI